MDAADGTFGHTTDNQAGRCRDPDNPSGPSDVRQRSAIWPDDLGRNEEKGFSKPTMDPRSRAAEEMA
jgi:hypothetical protein